MYYGRLGLGPRYGATVFTGRGVYAQPTVGFGGPSRLYPAIVTRYGYGYGARNPAFIGRGRRLARRLQQQQGPRSPVEQEAGQCQTLLELIEQRDDLSMLLQVLDDIPQLKQTFNDTSFQDTFFAPTNKAIEDLIEWGGFEDTQKGMQVMLGHGTNQTVETVFVAYHAVPDQVLALEDLTEGQLLPTALGPAWQLKVMPRTAEGGVIVSGIGSRTEVTEPGLDACNGRLFIIDRVLLPIDGDGVLTEGQQRHVEETQGLSATSGQAGEAAPAPADGPVG